MHKAAQCRLTELWTGSDNHLFRWYAENLTSYDPIFSPIPGGVLPSPWRDSVRFVRTGLSDRSLRIWCSAHIVTKGGQRANAQFDVRATRDGTRRRTLEIVYDNPG